MRKIDSPRTLPLVILLLSLAFCSAPALAANGTISLAYRGSGGSYIGDTIIFDGIDTVGNVTVLRLTGPDLPAGGVPVYDLTGKEGSGNPIEVNPDGTFRFVWYTHSIHGLENMQTARYFITAYDLADPSRTASASIMFKKPDFFVTPTPNPLETGDYLQLIGTAERGTPDIHIAITEPNGTVLHTYDTGASATGYFNYGFHIDMPPGEYRVAITSATMGTSYTTPLTVIPPQSPANGTTAAMQGATTPVTPVTTGTEAAPPVSGRRSILPLSPLSAVAGLACAAGIAVASCRGRKRS